jgi:hypothetical protein
VAAIGPRRYMTFGEWDIFSEAGLMPDHRTARPVHCLSQNQAVGYQYVGVATNLPEGDLAQLPEGVDPPLWANRVKASCPRLPRPQLVQLLVELKARPDLCAALEALWFLGSRNEALRQQETRAFIWAQLPKWGTRLQLAMSHLDDVNPDGSRP